jgi:hypothetical protein
MNFSVKNYGKLDWNNLTAEQRDVLNDVAQEFVDEYEEGVMDPGVANLLVHFEGGKPGDILIDVPGCSTWIVNVAESDMDAACVVMANLEAVGEKLLKALHALGSIGTEVVQSWVPADQGSERLECVKRKRVS